MICDGRAKKSRHRLLSLSAIMLCIVLSGCKERKEIPEEETNMTGLYDFRVLDIDGNEVQLSKYKGKVLLIVNVASKCGFTPQYEGLQNLYARYKEQGFVVLGFPSNDFLGQEPGTNEQIKTFCKLNYGVEFPLFTKISVKGRGMHPLYKFLTEKSTNPRFAGVITWNFNKFLIDRTGEIVNRFGSRTKPESPEIVTAIEECLK